MKKVGLTVLAVVGILLLMGGSFFAGKRYSEQSTTSERQSHPLLAKRLFMENPNDVLVNFEPLRSKIRTELGFYGEDDVSLYFEYLPTGTSIRYGANTHMVAASLLKLPLVMNLYHLSEDGTINMEDKIKLEEAWLDDQFGELYKKGAGYEMTIRELANAALEQSDNTAINGVQAILDAHNFPASESSLNALDVEYSDTQTTDLELSARSYSSFLKCLYFSCYLSQDNSQEVLASLARSTVGKDRLGKYIPDDIPLPHKIGVVGDHNQGDCGIVYLPNRHYELCILINDTQQRGSEIIAQISKFVYDYVREAN